MRMLAFAWLGGIMTLTAQTGNPIVDAYMRGVELRQRQEALEIQRRQLDQQLQQDRERLEVERERLRLLGLQNEAAEKATRQNPPQPVVTQSEAAAQVDQAFKDLRRMYSDFDDYLPNFPKVMALFAPQEGALRVNEYVEAIYVISKYASLLKAQISTETRPAESKKLSAR